MTTGSGGMSLRKLAKGLGVSQPFLSQIRAGKRPMPSALKERVEALGAYHLLIADKQNRGPGGGAPLSIDTYVGAGGGIRTPDFLLGRRPAATAWQPRARWRTRCGSRAPEPRGCSPRDNRAIAARPRSATRSCRRGRRRRSRSSRTPVPAPQSHFPPREGESAESLVNRFRASVQHSGILRELKDRRFFRSKAQKERLAAQRAARRRRRQNRR